MEERSAPITYDSQMRYYETLFNEMLSQRTDLISWIFCNDSKLDRVIRESTVKRESSWGPARVHRTRLSESEGVSKVLNLSISEPLSVSGELWVQHGARTGTHSGEFKRS